MVLPKRYQKYRLKKEWITAFQAWVQSLPPFSKKLLSFENTFPYQGEPYLISPYPGKEVVFEMAQKKVYIFEQTQDITRALKEALKEKALETLKQCSYAHAEKQGVMLGTIRVKDTKRQWGSCSPRNHLSYSWRLIMVPSFVLDYVCAHEVAHCLHRNHSAAFWNAVQDLHPSFQKARTWLRKNGSSLLSYG